MKIKVIIAGGRDFNDYDLLTTKCDRILSNSTNIVIVSGKAPGADTLGERYATERGYRIKEFPALWDDLTVDSCKIKTNRYGKKYNSLAGFNRNIQMAEYADALIAFWDGISSGTGSMIKLSKNLLTRIIYYDNNNEKGGGLWMK